MGTETPNLPKNALDTVIRKSRVHLYKPIQVAEILFHHRTEDGWKLKELESYRNISKRWRDEVSTLLTGRKCTSSQKYQDNLFEANAMPPELLARLGTINKKKHGMVEAYIYRALQARLSSVHAAYQYIETSTASNFSIKELLALFQQSPGLRRSVDKIYEILVYALFAAVVRALKVQVTLEIANRDRKMLKDFESFIKMVLAIDNAQKKFTLPANLYRVGVTNAADRGLDIWANFGLAIQVKHLSLKAQLVEDIADNINADRIVIVCLDAEREAIENLLRQVGWGSRIQGIITISDLDSWYQLCLRNKYRNHPGKTLLADLKREFTAEFPSGEEIRPFLKTRGYDRINMPSSWKIKS